MFAIFPPRSLPPLLQQLANILPLSALLEFVDVAAKLHAFELSGTYPLWNWPITPKGARLILSGENNTEYCCLDRPTKASMLHCIDGKFGDYYPSSSPLTTRLYVKAQSVGARIDNPETGSPNPLARYHTLHIFVTSRRGRNVPNSVFNRTMVRLFGNGAKSGRYLFTTLLGWLVWLCLVCLSLLSGLYLAVLYLVSMPLTGLVTARMFGDRPRPLIAADEPSSTNRLVIVTNSLNGCDWWAFYGPSRAVNALLNRPLLRSHPSSRSQTMEWLFRLLTLAQWVLAVGSSAWQTWDAIVISSWLFFCASVSTYSYPVERSVQDWLCHSCDIHIETQFSSRRSMLGALMVINPEQSAIAWMDPILAKSQERTEWSDALLQYTKDRLAPVSGKVEYWWKFVKEGVDVGVRLATVLHKHTQI